MVYVLCSMNKIIISLFLTITVALADPPFTGSQTQEQNQAQIQGQVALLRNQNNNNNLSVNDNRNRNSNRNVNANVNTNRNNNNSSAVATGGQAVSRATGGNATGGNATASPVVTVEDNSVTTQPDKIVVTDYVEWKKFQLYGRKASRSTPGATISNQDIRSVKPVTGYVAPANDKERYDAFLAAKGINSNTIGHATVMADRKMVVPTVEQQFAK